MTTEETGTKEVDDILEAMNFNLDDIANIGGGDGGDAADLGDLGLDDMDLGLGDLNIDLGNLGIEDAAEVDLGVGDGSLAGTGVDDVVVEADDTKKEDEDLLEKYIGNERQEELKKKLKAEAERREAELALEQDPLDGGPQPLLGDGEDDQEDIPGVYLEKKNSKLSEMELSEPPKLEIKSLPSTTKKPEIEENAPNQALQTPNPFEDAPEDPPNAPKPVDEDPLNDIEAFLQQTKKDMGFDDLETLLGQKSDQKAPTNPKSQKTPQSKIDQNSQKGDSSSPQKSSKTPKTSTLKLNMDHEEDYENFADQLIKEISSDKRVKQDDVDNIIDAFVNTDDLEGKYFSPIGSPTKLHAELVEDLDLNLAPAPNLENNISDFFGPLPPINESDDLVKTFRRECGLNIPEINKIVETRFGGKDDLQLSTIKRKATQINSVPELSAPTRPKRRVLTPLSILNKIEGDTHIQMAELHLETEERAKNYFSSLQEGEWTDINEDNISPVDVQYSKTISEMLNSKQNEKITAFACSQTSNRLFLCGTKSGQILECEIPRNKVRTLNPVTGEVIACDISPDDSIWAIGTTKSEILIKKSLGGWARYSTQNFNGRPIIQLRFINSSELLICTDRTVTKYYIADMKFKFEISPKQVIKNEENITQIMTMPIRKRTLLITAQLDKLLFTMISPVPGKTKFLPRPEYIERGWAPIVSWVIQENRGFYNVIVFWKNYIYLIKKSQEGEYIIDAQKCLKSNIIWGTVLGNRVVCMLDEKYELTLQSVEYLFANFASGGGFGGVHQLPKERLSDARTVCVREDGKITISCIGRIRCLGESVGFLTNGGLVKANLLTIKQLTDKYIEKGKWLPALRLCVEVSKKKIIASEAEVKEIRQAVVEMTRKYIDTFAKVDPSTRLGASAGDHLLASIVAVSIEAMFETDNMEAIFSVIRSKVDQKVFWNEVEKFILNGKIKQVPHFGLLLGSMHLSKKALNLLLLQIPVEGLQDEAEYFAQILSLIKRKRLWLPFIRISLSLPGQVLKVFLSSLMLDMMTLPQEVISYETKNLSTETELAHILDECSFHSEADISKILKVYWFLWKIANWKAVSCFVEPQMKPLVWENLLSWLFEDENSDNLAKACSQLYFEILFDLFMNHEIMVMGDQRLKDVLVGVWKRFIGREKLRAGKRRQSVVVSEATTAADSRGSVIGDLGSEGVSEDGSRSENGPEGPDSVPESTGAQVPGGELEKPPSRIVTAEEPPEPPKPQEKLENKPAPFKRSNSMQLPKTKKLTLHEELNLPDWFLDDTNAQCSQASMARLILLLLEVKLDKEAQKFNLALFFVRILNISMFSELFKHKKWIKHHLATLLSEPIGVNTYWMYYKLANKGDIEEQIVRVLQIAKYDSETLGELSELARASKYNKVFAYLQDAREGPVKSLEVHMQNAAELSGGEEIYIFRWLSNQFDELSKEETPVLKDLTNEVIKYIPDLIRIDKSRARDVIIKFMSSGPNTDTVSLLECYPDLQINYIETLLEIERKKREHPVPLNLKLKYLELKCNFDPDQVVKILNRYSFPLDESLKICKTHQRHLAVAHITYRLGLTEEAVQEYLSIIQMSFDSYLHGMGMERAQIERLVSDAQFCFKMVLGICLDMAKQNEVGYKELFETFLNFVIESYLNLRKKDVYDTTNIEVLVKISELSRYVKDCFIEKLMIHYAQEVGTAEIVEIIDYNPLMRALQLKDYKGIIRFLTFERKIMKDITSICGEGQRQYKAKYISKVERGQVKSNKCSITNENLMRDVLLLQCAHPVDLMMASSRARYPIDYKCPRCADQVFVERRLMSKIYKVEQTDIKKHVEESLMREARRHKAEKRIGFSEGFERGADLDAVTEKEVVDMYTKIMAKDRGFMNMNLF